MDWDTGTKLADGQTVPHDADTLDVMAVWRASLRAARIRQRASQVAFWLCAVAITLAIALNH